MTELLEAAVLQFTEYIKFDFSKRQAPVLSPGLRNETDRILDGKNIWQSASKLESNWQRVLQPGIRKCTLIVCFLHFLISSEPGISKSRRVGDNNAP